MMGWCMIILLIETKACKNEYYYYFSQVSDCFAVPHKERNDEVTVEINQEYHKSMYSFHRRNNKKRANCWLVHNYHQYGSVYHRYFLVNSWVLFAIMKSAITAIRCTWWSIPHCWMIKSTQEDSLVSLWCWIAVMC